MQKIVPHLWYEDKAEEAARFYASIFKNSSIGNISRYGEAGAKISGRPKDSVMTVSFKITGYEFIALNGGPLFKFTPSVSFLVACKTRKEVDAIWEKLSAGGTALMELGKYPHSERYGWTQDRYGLSWQVMSMGDRETRQSITPTLMFTGDQWGKAEAAIKLNTSVFKDAATGNILRYAKGEEPDKEWTIKHGAFTLEKQGFAAMDSARVHGFTFNEAISLLVNCETQAEIDRLWQKLTAGGEESMCGWLKDKYGLSWQISPTVLNKYLTDPDPVKAERVMKVFLQMKKIDISALKKAYEGR